jgi:hypothetical protein
LDAVVRERVGALQAQDEPCASGRASRVDIERS